MIQKLTPAIIATLFVNAAAIAAEPGPAKDVPELAVLKHWEGVWNARIEKPTRRTGTSRGEWVAGGRYLQQSWKVAADQDNPEISGTWLMTYDVQEKIYRQWQFNSDGFTAQATGKWDTESHTMTWTTRDEGLGSAKVNKDHFAKDGEQDWSIVITDRDGEKVFEMTGHNSRQNK